MRRDLQIACVAVGAIALVLLAAVPSFTPGALTLARLAILGGALGLIAVYDIREHRIPNRIVLPAALACASLSLAQGVHPTAGLYAAAALVGVLLTISLLAPRALGMGDVKLALLILCALGNSASLALLIAFEFYALSGLALRLSRGRKVIGTTLPLAPIIAAACIFTVLL
jgi:leader peptidase (prepilin peptidase) / N-methyltransferase